MPPVAAAVQVTDAPARTAPNAGLAENDVTVGCCAQSVAGDIKTTARRMVAVLIGVLGITDFEAVCSPEPHFERPQTRPSIPRG